MNPKKPYSLTFIFLLLSLISCNKIPKDLPEEVSIELDKLNHPLDYVYDIKPILSDRCFACHGPDEAKVKGGLRLDNATTAYKKNKESGLKAIIPGNPAKSELIFRILSDDSEIVMPTPESHLSLTAEEKAKLIKWIEQGAEYKDHWAFGKLKKPAIPKVKQQSWPKNDIDYFVLNKLENKRLIPANEAEKTTLLRRVFMDLSGLPPSPEQIDQFLKDNSPNAYEKIVDQLLQSPHYGEHMGVAWLDIARYADTHGYQDDGNRTAWPYRDWVIKAFNQNLPFDKFVTWQLAGDLVEKPGKEQLIATAFNRMHQQSQEGGIIPEEYRTEYVADRVDTFGKTFLGLTVECARCHDHKYDPISQKDYFSLYAFFNNNNENGQIPYNGEASPAITVPTTEAEETLKFIHTRLSSEHKTLNQIQQNPLVAYKQWLKDAPKSPEQHLVHPDQDLIGYFTFDEPEGREFSNLANAGHTGKAEGSDSLSKAASIPGKFGKARYIYGDNAVNMGRDFAFFERSDAFTISIWLKIESDKTVGSLLHKSNGVMNGYRGWNIIRESDGTMRLTISHIWPENAIELQTVDQFPMQEWAHIAFTYDGLSKASGTKLYVNGTEAEVNVLNDNLTQSLLFGKKKSNWYMDNLLIGRLSDQYTKDFAVDEMKIFTRALTPLEMKGLHSGKNEVKLALLLPENQRNDFQTSALTDYYLHNLDTTYCQTITKSRQLIQEETDLLGSQIDVMVMKERKYPRKTFILARGVYDAPTTEVSADTPDQLFKMPKDFPRNRLGLAQWLLHENNPLFSRVTVNRFWQNYFGHGLVISSADFGNQGDLPTHPELLDWLAVRFRESGWDVKALQKLIVTSATYRQSSVFTQQKLEIDGDNLFYSRGPSYRMSAEQIRDNALAASGVLTRKIGGESVHPYQPDGLWEALATRNEVSYKQNHGDSLYRRSMYTIWKRSAPPPMMLNFDAAERHFCVVSRQKTSTPLQALVVMNDPQFVEASRVLAAKMMATGTTAADRIKYGFKSLTGRAPRDQELSILLDLYQQEYVDFQRNPRRVTSLLKVGEYPVDNKVNKTELASHTIVASTIMNFDEFLIKR